VVTGVAWGFAVFADHGLREPGPLVGLAVVAGLAMVTLPLTAAVVGVLTHRQEARARYLELEQPEPRHRPLVERFVLGTAVATAAVVALVGLVVWPVADADAKAPGAGSSWEAYGVDLVVPFRFAVTTTEGSGDAFGSMVAVNSDGRERIELGWVSGMTSGDEALFGLVDAAIAGLREGEEDIFYRGRPVPLTVAGLPALLENFSIGVGSNMIYGAVLAAPCAASDRTMIMAVVVDSTRPARNAMTQAVIPGLHC
jgi:hypothetical protein